MESASSCSQIGSVASLELHSENTTPVKDKKKSKKKKVTIHSQNSNWKFYELSILSNNSSPLRQCLKIPEKVAFNIASEASYVYFLSGQKFIKNAKKGHFLNLKLTVKQYYQTCHF